jgi:serine/threonine-protein kinase
MHKINEVVCPHCFFDNNQIQEQPYLPLGTVLQERYIIGTRLEANGESTRYIGYDRRQGAAVIVQEYLPVGLCERGTGQKALSVPVEKLDAYNKIQYEYSRFFKALQRLKGFSAILKIVDVFEDNNTVYFVEEYEELVPFEDFIDKKGGHADWDTLRPMFMPVISALEALHKLGYGHYGIAPANLYVTTLGKLKISGFATEFERKRGTPLKSQLFSGSSAPEQYERNFVLDKATDIYGFCATLFYALTGSLPKNAQERLTDSRLLMSTSTAKRLPPHVITAMANGLNIGRENRTTDFEELRTQLSAAQTVQAIQEEISRTASMTPLKDDSQNKSSADAKRTNFIIALAASLAVFAIIGYIWMSSNPFGGLFNSGDAVPITTSPADESWTGPVVPNYVGQNYDSAAAQAESSGEYKVFRAENDEYSDTVAEGTIISQTPAAGTAVHNAGGNATVTVVVSKGPMMRQLPNIDNKMISDAAKTLANAGFLVEKVPEYGTQGENKVLGYSDHSAGEKLEAGTLVRVRVCVGPQTTEPNSN